MCECASMLQGQAKRKKAQQVGGASGKVDNYFFIIAGDNNNYRLFLRADLWQGRGSCRHYAAATSPSEPLSANSREGERLRL